MFPIITEVLITTIGGLLDKARDIATARLKDGDLMDEQCRQLLMRELDDIKTKLDGLARKDLLASVSFLEEGICLLSMSVDQLNINENGQTTGQALRAEAVINNPSCLALSQAVACLKIVSQERLSTAKSRFKAALEEATRAFSNEALSVEDRILATKLRVMSRLFESLEDPEAAANSCILYVDALHKVPAVQQMFSVYVNGGMKARFNKTKRLENLKSVTMINVVVFVFAWKFTKFWPNFCSWPKIKVGQQLSYSTLEDRKILKELRDSGVDMSGPDEIKLNHKDVFCTDMSYSAVNSKREIITISCNNPGVLKVIDSTGEIKTVCSLPEQDTRARGFEIRSLAIDADDFVHVVTRFEEPEDVYYYKLFVCNNKFEIKKQISLEFLTKYKSRNNSQKSINITVNKDKKVFIREHGFKDRVYVCADDGTLLHSFAVKQYQVSWCRPPLSISDKSEVIVSPLYGRSVYIYTEAGELKRSIQLPEDYMVRGVAFHHVTKNVIVHTKHRVNDCIHLLSYSETGDLQTLPLLHDADDHDKLTSHPSGPVAFVYEKGVIFI